MGYTNELYHHGIKGQKWGVRRFQNPDGSRTAAGRKRESVTRKKATVENAEKLATAIKSGGYYSDAVQRAAKAVVDGGVDSEFDKTVASVTRYAERLHADADANYHPNIKRYSAIAGYAAADRFGQTDAADRENTAKWYIYDDGDQGSFNSYNYYLCSKGSDPNKFNKEYAQVYRKLDGEAKRVANDLLGDHASDVTSANGHQETASETLRQAITNAAYDRCSMWGPWSEGNGTYPKEDITQMKADVKRYANAPIPNLWHSDARQDYLMHFGIKGQKWGVRRFQNPDGTRTPEGAARELKRYRKRELRQLDRMNRKQTKKDDKQIAKAQIKMSRAAARGGPLFRKARVTKQQYKLENLKQQKLYRQGLYASERAKVMRMTIGEMDSEKAGLTKNRGERSVMQMFSKGRLDREFKTGQRVTEEQRQNAYSNAYMMRSAMS